MFKKMWSSHYGFSISKVKHLKYAILLKLERQQNCILLISSKILNVNKNCLIIGRYLPCDSYSAFLKLLHSKSFLPKNGTSNIPQFHIYYLIRQYGNNSKLKLICKKLILFIWSWTFNIYLPCFEQKTFFPFTLAARANLVRSPFTLRMGVVKLAT